MKIFILPLFFALTFASNLLPNYPQYPDAPPLYSYAYSVKNINDYNNLNFNQEEKRDGILTEGQYKVLLPDGRTQIVSYSVNGDSGFIANVAYEGQSQESSINLYPSLSQSKYKDEKYQEPYPITYILNPSSDKSSEYRNINENLSENVSIDSPSNSLDVSSPSFSSSSDVSYDTEAFSSSFPINDNVAPITENLLIPSLNIELNSNSQFPISESLPHSVSIEDNSGLSSETPLIYEPSSGNHKPFLSSISDSESEIETFSSISTSSVPSVEARRQYDPVRFNPFG